MDYKIVYDTTVFIDESVHEVYKTLFEAFVLVFIVVLVFLQDWRATLMPMIDVPVSLIGTFAVMALLGFSLNNLTLFGLVLAIGIVVDDAIVVVENIERWMAKGLPPREATIKAMDEITGPVIAITLVLSSVFIPTAFLAGITGQFYRQFALTIAASTIISAINAMTMAPARAVTLIKPHVHGQESQREALPRWGYRAADRLFRLSARRSHGHGDCSACSAGRRTRRRSGGSARSVAGRGLERAVWCCWPPAASWAGSSPRPVNAVLNRFLGGFNWVFDRLSGGYGFLVRGLLRVSFILLLVYGGLLALTGLGFKVVPKGFIPDQDKGYLVVNVQLPDGASLERTDRLVTRAQQDRPGDRGRRPRDRRSRLLHAAEHQHQQRGRHVRDPGAVRRAEGGSGAARPAGSPPSCGRSSTPSRKPRSASSGPRPSKAWARPAASSCRSRTSGTPGSAPCKGPCRPRPTKASASRASPALFSTFSVTQPQIFVEIDREKAKAQAVSLDDVNNTLQSYLGSYYVNDFTFQNRNWQVNIQADPKYRMRVEDIGRLEVRNAKGDRVPLATLIHVKDTSGPAIVNHYNLYPSAEITGILAPGISSRQGIEIMDRVAGDQLPSTMGYEWTELSFQELLAEKDLLSKLVFPLAVLFVFMVLAAQYESWSLPLAILLIVPMCLLSALLGLWLVEPGQQHLRPDRVRGA